MRSLRYVGVLLLAACTNTGTGPGPGMSGADLSAGPGADLRSVVDLRMRLPDLPELPDLSPAPDLSLVIPPGYPAGPYGPAVGQTLTPLLWEGYLNPTAVGLANAKPYVPYGADDLRTSGKRYALVYAADDF